MRTAALHGRVFVIRGTARKFFSRRTWWSLHFVSFDVLFLLVCVGLKTYRRSLTRAHLWTTSSPILPTLLPSNSTRFHAPVLPRAYPPTPPDPSSFLRTTSRSLRFPSISRSHPSIHHERQCKQRNVILRQRSLTYFTQARAAPARLRQRLKALTPCSHSGSRDARVSSS